MILGHTPQLEYFKKVITRGRLAHAYLFSGPAHVGKLTAAIYLAKLLHCEGARVKPCGECGECCRIEQGQHPHVFLLDREHTLVSKKESRKDIPIEDIRELKRIFSYAPEGGKWRVVILNDAEKLSPEAANALLKLLEEPGQKTLLILVSAAPELLLPTIRSRVQPVSFSLVADRVLAEFLETKNIGKAAAEELISYAAGRPGVLFSLLGDPVARERAQKLSLYIERLFSSRDITEAFRASERFSQSDELSDQAIAVILNRVRRNLFSRLDDPPEVIANAVGKVKEMDRIVFLLATTNVNRRLALDVFFLHALA